MGYKYNTEEERLQGLANSREKYRATDKYKETLKKINARVIAERKSDEEKREKYNAYQREYRARKKLEQPQNENKLLTEEEKRERRKVTARKSYLKNKEKRKEKLKQYYNANREEIIEKNKQYYQEHKTEIAERKRQWRLRKIMEQYK